MDQRTFDTKVKELAEKLKSNGIAISDAQARQMAADIINTERRAIKEQTKAIKEERIDVDPEPKAPAQTAVPDEREQFQHDDPLVRRAIAQHQSNAKKGGTDESIDQDRPIGELMAEAEQPRAQAPREEKPPEEKPSSSTQPHEASGPAKITLDNPVVDQGEPKKTLVGEEPDGPSGGSLSLDNPVVTQERPEQRGAQPQSDSGSPQQDPPSQPEQQQAQNQQEAEQPAEKEESPEKKVDLSEMFNFSKRK